MNTAQRATLAAAELRELAPRARVRTLTAPDIARAIRLHLAACRKARRDWPQATIKTTKVGGHVANSYMGAAHCDAVTITGQFAKDLTVTAERKYARKTYHATGPTLLVRLFGWRSYGEPKTRGTIVRRE